MRTMRRDTPIGAAALLLAAVALAGCGDGGLAGSLRAAGVAQHARRVPGAARPGRSRCRATSPRCRRPTPGAVNRVDYRPRAEAIAGLTGRPHGGHRQRRGARRPRRPRRPAIRARLAVEDAEWRATHRGRLLERWFSRDREELTYRDMRLDAPVEFERLRASGVQVPPAPPALLGGVSASRLRAPRLHLARPTRYCCPATTREGRSMRLRARRPRPDAAAGGGAGRGARRGDLELHARQRPRWAVVIEDHRAPVVTHMVWYRVGSADEPPGQSGIAHFLEHLMFKAHRRARRRRVQPHRRRERRRRQRLHLARLHRLLPAHRRRPARPRDGDGGRPDGRPRARRRRACAPSATWCSRSAGRWWRTTPSGPFSEQRRAALYLNHPYGHPVIGWPHEIEALHLREGAGLLPRALRAEQRHPGGRGRRRPGRGRAAGRAALRPDPGRGRGRRRASARRSRRRSRRAARRAARRRACASPTSPQLPRAAAPARRPGRRRRRCRCWRELLGGSGITSVLARELVLGDGDRARRRRLPTPTSALDPQSFTVYVVPKPGVPPGRGRGRARRADRSASSPRARTRRSSSGSRPELAAGRDLRARQPAGPRAPPRRGAGLRPRRSPTSRPGPRCCRR